ncbi:ATP synthase subunit I [Silvibacterium sp.]|uniref:ATP synthase subunit I n=1 Tax=Silvibacterium sp. TaxID=1964179 RepID=UPI0039E66C04
MLNFTDADLAATMRRAMRLCGILTLIACGVFGFTQGWIAALACLAGGIISITGLYEWQRLISFVNDKLDGKQTPRTTFRVVSMFFLRLTLAGGLLYVTLKCSHGMPYGLVTSLGLGVVALTVEAVRLLRS